MREKREKNKQCLTIMANISRYLGNIYYVYSHSFKHFTDIHYLVCSSYQFYEVGAIIIHICRSSS